jgi:5'-3' exonuclease
MGIPSYFSYIVKNHSKIIKKIISNQRKINNLYMDSNSIIYDSFYKIQTDYGKLNQNQFETKLIKEVIKKINEYIKIIKPVGKVIVAFDGVAPTAKLKQQRNRRYKSALEKILKDDKEKGWDKTAITPGTNFMNKLGKRIKNNYKKNSNIIVSDSSEPGEGEHKIFSYIRNNKDRHRKEVTMIYGLDADLIMLCLNHIPISNEIYLFRETPDFIKSINSDLEPNSNYYLDIPELAKYIIYEMNGQREANNIQEKNKLYDYIFLCFFLGNDFMPHFPSLPIRNGAIHILKAAYYNVLGRRNRNLTDGKEIYWGNVKKFIEYLSQNEYNRIMDEYKHNEKLEKRTKKYEKMIDKLNDIPIKNRDNEIYIDPYNPNWEQRYYKTLFDIDINNYYRKKICMNYLQGLEWTMNYYTNDCIDWSWKYNYNYAPLLKDLVNFTPSWEVSLIKENDNKAIPEIAQLCYVLPESSMDLIPKKIKEEVKKEFNECYNMNFDIEWTFCRYFWEGHVKLPEINMEKLINIVVK